jgi:hypothetical protein
MSNLQAKPIQPTGEGWRLPYTVGKTDGAYEVVDRQTGKVYARHTTRKKAERQRRLLEGIRHGRTPTVGRTEER